MRLRYTVRVSEEGHRPQKGIISMTEHELAEHQDEIGCYVEAKYEDGSSDIECFRGWKWMDGILWVLFDGPVGHRCAPAMHVVELRDLTICRSSTL